MRIHKVAAVLMTLVLSGEALLPLGYAAEEETHSGGHKSAAGAKKGDGYENSKYKSFHTLAEHSTYRFDAGGNPIKPAAKKEPSKKKGAKKPAAALVAEYVCPMGDYHGPQTKDGRCPKCGMMLQRKQESSAPAAAQPQQATQGQTQQEIYVCPMGDYRGPNTQDGRCPKCGMMLQKQ